jgi:battenin
MLVSVVYGMVGNATHCPQVVALNESLAARLLGISLASFSSGSSDLPIQNATSLLVGLCEMTFLQLSTTYNLAVGGHSVE